MAPLQLPGPLNQVTSAVGGAATEVASDAQTVATGIADTVTSGAVGVEATVTSGAVGVESTITSGAVGLESTITSGAVGAFNTAKSTAEGIIGDVKDWSENLMAKALWNWLLAHPWALAIAAIICLLMLYSIVSVATTCIKVILDCFLGVICCVRTSYKCSICCYKTTRCACHDADRAYHALHDHPDRPPHPPSKAKSDPDYDPDGHKIPHKRQWRCIFDTTWCARKCGQVPAKFRNAYKWYGHEKGRLHLWRLHGFSKGNEKRKEHEEYEEKVKEKVAEKIASEPVDTRRRWSGATAVNEEA